MSAGIDRRALVGRHAIVLTEIDPLNPMTVGNGDFGFTVDATGLQSFTTLHDATAAEAEGRLTVPTSTLSTWAWHEMPNPEGYVLDDAMTEYETSRGAVRYPDRFDIRHLLGEEVGAEFAAGTWLHVNPQRLDLGRLGLTLRDEHGGRRPFEPSDIEEVRQRLDLWRGVIESTLTVRGTRIDVETLAHPSDPTVSTVVSSPLLVDGTLGLRLRFAYPSDGFFATADWTAQERHRSELRRAADGSAVIERQIDATDYAVAIRTSGTVRPGPQPHRFDLDSGGSDRLEAAIRFTVEADPRSPAAHGANRDAAEQHWRAFWSSGAAVDLAGSDDPRAAELERRIVLSQYLTAVNCSGTMPPQETGLVTNSWQGKAHLEMHWWHAAHFAAWGRPGLLRRSLPWYLDILDRARETAAAQHYAGARWPKQVGPDGRESPTDIGALLVWQQPHLLYFLELLHRAGETGLAEEFGAAITATAEFMADFVERREDGMHIPAPVMPAQEFYDARTTEDPTFELAYWWWGLEIAQRWEERAGRPRRDDWQRVIDDLVAPKRIETGYAAIATEPYLRRDDHPSMLAALGVLPPNRLIDVQTMRATLLDVVGHWDWDTAWGWDYPVMAMTATRLGEPEHAVDLLLKDATKNRYSTAGHNPQMGNALPLYLPGNGGLLAAVSLMVAGSDSGVAELGGFPASGWTVRHEGLLRWP